MSEGHIYTSYVFNFHRIVPRKHFFFWNRYLGASRRPPPTEKDPSKGEFISHSCRATACNKGIFTFSCYSQLEFSLMRFLQRSERKQAHVDLPATLLLSSLTYYTVGGRLLGRDIIRKKASTRRSATLLLL